jgi:membrane protease YdiL (CAAX protease family)
MRRKHVEAVGTAAGLVAWKFASQRLPTHVHPFANAAVGAGLVLWTRAPLGLRPPALWRGLRIGAGAAVLIAGAVAIGTALPPVRTAISRGQVPDGSAARWLLLRIPLGTAWAEEASYRGALTSRTVDAFGPTRGRLFTSAAFGLSHIADARSAGEPLAGTAFTTGAAGWVFAWLGERSGSVAAPMLAHLALNESGALAALAVQRGAAIPGPFLRPR